MITKTKTTFQGIVHQGPHRASDTGRQAQGHLVFDSLTPGAVLDVNNLRMAGASFTYGPVSQGDDVPSAPQRREPPVR